MMKRKCKCGHSEVMHIKCNRTECKKIYHCDKTLIDGKTCQCENFEECLK